MKEHGLGRNDSELFPFQELACVPRPESFESPSSWITRAALSQWIKPEKLIKYLGLNVEREFDRAFVQNDLDTLAQRCGLPSGCFDFMRHMFTQLSRLKHSERYLLIHDGLPRYRFCPLCLKDQQTKHLPLHWRFKVWRWCPDHQQLLSDFCQHCGGLVLLPGNLLKVGQVRGELPYLDHCLLCGRRLSFVSGLGRFSASKECLMPREKKLLANGRAVLAALYYSHVVIENVKGEPEVFPLETLDEIERAGQIPNYLFHYEKWDAGRRMYRQPLSGQIIGRNPPGQAVRDFSPLL